jgi:hypothetical protein
LAGPRSVILCLVNRSAICSKIRRYHPGNRIQDGRRHVPQRRRSVQYVHVPAPPAPPPPWD